MDRGYVILDIHYTYPEDSGQYHCVAKNNAGATPSNVVELRQACFELFHRLKTFNQLSFYP